MLSYRLIGSFALPNQDTLYLIKLRKSASSRCLAIGTCIAGLTSAHHRRRINTESKANCRRLRLGGKIECQTGNFWCESVSIVYIAVVQFSFTCLPFINSSATQS